ncbi:MAG TPA: hypothetical protein VH590_18375, partial [Ktedonobacterales bacterium]
LIGHTGSPDLFLEKIRTSVPGSTINHNMVCPLAQVPISHIFGALLFSPVFQEVKWEHMRVFPFKHTME